VGSGNGVAVGDGVGGGADVDIQAARRGNRVRIKRLKMRTFLRGELFEKVISEVVI
jgi:hypothetical protein